MFKLNHNADSTQEKSRALLDPAFVVGKINSGEKISVQVAVLLAPSAPHCDCPAGQEESG